jgi:hypothetical protein
MRHDTSSQDRGTWAAQAPPYRGSVVHHHDHCALRCPYCGPDSSAWAVGELVLAAVIALAVLGWWLARNPAVALAVAVILLGGWFLVA